MRVLVTGGAGFIGSHLVHKLLVEGHKPVVVDTLFHGVPDDFPMDRCVLLQGRVTNADLLRRAMRDVKLVYHLAGRYDDPKGTYGAATLFQCNTMGTAWVLTVAQSLGVQKVVFTSTAAVYGVACPGVVGEEVHPVSYHGASKLAAETICRAFPSLEVSIFRLFNVYGPGGRGVVDAFEAGGKVIYGDGSQTCDFIHVSDVVDALWRARHWDRGTYNVGTGIETSVLDLFHKIHGPDAVPEYEHARHKILHSRADMTGSIWKAKETL